MYNKLNYMKNLYTFEEFINESAETLMDNIQLKIKEIKHQIKNLPEENREKQEEILRERLRILHEKKGKINTPINEARDKNYELKCDNESVASNVLHTLRNHFLINAHQDKSTNIVTFTSEESQSQITGALGNLMDGCILTMESVNNESKTLPIYTKQKAIDYIKRNDAKYYKVELTKGQSRVFNDKQKADAIASIKGSNINSYELSTYGQTIHFSQPFDINHANRVRGFGLNN